MGEELKMVKNRKGFTLVEMIISIIIIGILTAMVGPKLFSKGIDAKVTQTVTIFSMFERQIAQQQYDYFANMTDIYNDGCNDVGGDGDYLNDLVCKHDIEYNPTLSDQAVWNIKIDTLSTGEQLFYTEVVSANPKDIKVLQELHKKYPKNSYLQNFSGAYSLVWNLYSDNNYVHNGYDNWTDVLFR